MHVLPKIFFQASSLITLKDAPHKCNLCERKVTKSSYLILHFESSQPKCMYCPKYFLKSTQLTDYFKSFSEHVWAPLLGMF